MASAKEMLMDIIEPTVERQYGGGLDDAYMTLSQRRSSAFADPNANSAFASPISQGGLPTVYRQDPGSVGTGDEDWSDYDWSSVYGTPTSEEAAANAGRGANENDWTDPANWANTGLDDPTIVTTPAAPPEASDPDAGAGWGFGVGAPGISRTDPNQTFENVLDNIPSELGPQYYERQLNKEGFPKWTWPYYNSLKDRGMTNEEATAALAAAMATPGGLSGMQSAYEDGYSYGGPMGTMQDLLEKGIQSRFNIDKEIEDDKDIKAYNKDDDEEFLSEGELAVSGLKGIYDKISNFLSVKGDVTPTTMALIDAKAEEQGLEFTPASNIMGNVMNVLLPSVAKGLSNLTGAGRTIGTITDPKTGQSFNVSDTGKFSLNWDTQDFTDLGTSDEELVKSSPVKEKVVASVTEEAPKTGIAGYFDRLNRERPRQSREASNEYARRLLADLYPTNTPRLG